jgi:hypothetical protein
MTMMVGANSPVRVVSTSTDSLQDQMNPFPMMTLSTTAVDMELTLLYVASLDNEGFLLNFHRASLVLMEAMSIT